VQVGERVRELYKLSNLEVIGAYVPGASP